MNLSGNPGGSCKALHWHAAFSPKRSQRNTKNLHVQFSWSHHQIRCGGTKDHIGSTTVLPIQTPAAAFSPHRPRKIWLPDWQRWPRPQSCSLAKGPCRPVSCTNGWTANLLLWTHPLCMTLARCMWALKVTLGHTAKISLHLPVEHPLRGRPHRQRRSWNLSRKA